jgi:hypothetical protein
MDIPVFVSCPTTLSARQSTARSVVLSRLEACGLEPRILRSSDYPAELPLREVLVIARHCAGGVVLGFEQYRALGGIRKPGTPGEARQDSVASFPTPWSHLEAGIMFGIGLPLLIFREAGISGGIFDSGVTDLSIHPMPSNEDDEGLDNIFADWTLNVRHRYYGG